MAAYATLANILDFSMTCALDPLCCTYASARWQLGVSRVTFPHGNVPIRTELHIYDAYWQELILRGAHDMTAGAWQLNICSLQEYTRKLRRGHRYAFSPGGIPSYGKATR